MQIVQEWRRDHGWWRLLARDVTAAVVAREPGDRVMSVDDDGLDAVCRAFADIIDAKSPFTYRHSTRVADVAPSARILVVSDMYDALTSDRPYRAGLSFGAAFAILERDRDSKLCGIALDGLSAVTRS
ncbi:MAG: hypothetical protein H0W68_03820 [Gemmatimonadaceae bacterium]|nr:hypothetical protein [Gemmatimonadaceae bacterium]